MKKVVIAVGILFIVGCKKDRTADKIEAKWKLVSVTDSTHTTYASATHPCVADDELEISESHATITQGDCIQFRDKPRTLTFSWKYVSSSVVDMGGDTVNIVTLNDSVLHFTRPDPQFLDYKWKK